MITSNDNSLIKKYQKLSSKKWRHIYQIVPLEGELLIKEALHSGMEFDYVLYSQDIEKTDMYRSVILSLLQKGVKCRAVSPKLFSKITFTDQPQGIAAVIKFIPHTAEEILASSNSVLVLYQVSDPGNMGTLIRSADAFGYDGVICTKGCVDPTNDKVVRSSMGSLFHIPVSINSIVLDLLSKLQSEDFISLIAEPDNGTAIDQLKINNSSVAVFVGNEVHGFCGTNELLEHEFMSTDYVQKCKIPMRGKAESLNAGVAGSIIMYEISKMLYS